jgi:hypothetical protein
LLEKQNGATTEKQSGNKKKEIFIRKPDCSRSSNLKLLLP